jgi:hypothetical protein
VVDLRRFLRQRREDEDEELEGKYEFAVKQLQTIFEERARLAMQLTAAKSISTTKPPG